MAGSDEALDNFSADGGEDGNFGSCLRWILHERFGIVDAQNAQSVFAGLEIGLSLVAIGLGLLKVGLGDGAMRQEILRTREELVGEEKSVACLYVGGTGRGVVWTVDGEERLPFAHGFAGRDEEFMDGPAHGGEDRGSHKGVVGH